MPRKSNPRAAQGAGTIRKKTDTPTGRPASQRATILAQVGRFNGPSRAKPKKRYEKRWRP